MLSHELCHGSSAFWKDRCPTDLGGNVVQKTNEDLKAKLELGLGGTNAQARLRDREGYIASLQVKPKRALQLMAMHESNSAI